jgi:flagellar motor switch protein FliM
VGRADVLLDENRLFTAAVAEHKGKLCLTSFEDAE